MKSSSRSWDKRVAKELRDVSYAQAFLSELLAEGDDLQTALGRLIRLYGVKEYSRLVKLETPAVQRAIDPKHNPTKETLERLLAPLKLELGVKPTDAA